MHKSWYCIRSKPNKEEFLCSQLRASEIETFYPRLRSKPVNPRSRTVRPFFPGYMFINVNLEEVGANTLHWMPGAQGLVFFGNEPAPVQEEIINTIRHQVEAANRASENRLAGLKPGDRVRIAAGPFAGYEAVFDTSLPGNERVRVFLALLERQHMKLELPGHYIQTGVRH